MNPKQIKLASVAAAVVTAGGVGTVLTTWWPSVGWKTPESHRVDIEQIEAEHTQANQELLKAIQQFNRQWECDERAESVEATRLEMLRFDPQSAEWIAKDEYLQSLRSRQDVLSCSEFAD